jgi:serine/threonine protein kinase
VRPSLEIEQLSAALADGPRVPRSKPSPPPPEQLDSTAHVALARLPPRRPARKGGSHFSGLLTDFREFQDGEMVPGTRYRVTRLIGAGGMGRVYEVEHVELGKRFVLKALQRELARREDLVARLRNEWRALARLQHPNIVNVTDAGTSENGVPFYVMERLEGETLSTLLHRARRLLPQQALAIAAGILDGLHAAHQIGVVHRDVKPPNIFLIGPTTVKVLDFGIAKIQDAGNVITARGMAVGTPRYMSPEQASGTAVDARSDVYATGLMLFEMVSGVGPFDDARDNNELLLAQLGRKAPLLSSMSVVAPELDALVAGMLAKDPRERPRDAHQVAEALRDLAQRYERSVATDAPTRAAPPTAAAEPPTRVDRPRRASPSAAPPTRPDGVAAGRPALREETTTLQPRLEIATTVVPQSNRGGTQRLPEAPALPPATLYGPDTLVDRTTSAPTAVPGPAPERTETLLVVPPTPGGSAAPDPGVTRTAVPAAEAPNLTPPPVVPIPSTRSPQASRSRRGVGIAATAVLSLGVLLVVIALRTPAPAPPAEPGREAASAPAPEPLSVEPPRVLTVPGAPHQPPPALAVSAAPRKPAPSSSSLADAPPPVYELATSQNQGRKSDATGRVPAPRTTPAAPSGPKTAPKSPPAMPGSGL